MKFIEVVPYEMRCGRCGHPKQTHKAMGWSLYDVCQERNCDCAQFLKRNE